ncbi:hypothetical protein [Pseudoclavibacter sp. VKM Ac-2867]|uniref:hypothetical protein n=1 Tax=Pseudoclavibacter sp. VKM Ac-2867 TaxID=2783829 RepID=UPI00188D4655|nr:hypothetical protein [Pseudoclavibacter sp. VKM Ac-2867]MBF4457337.1 hypothetical protein [Pseudoclavibacter sp. VKM Ac-2867]
MRTHARRIAVLTIALLATALLSVLPTAGVDSAEAANSGQNRSTRLEQDDPRIKYSGPWGKLTSASDSGGSSVYLTSAGSLSFTFTGTRVIWLGRVTPSGGTASVSIDGGTPTSVSRYATATQYTQTAFDSGELSQGQHTIKISWTSTKPMGSTGTSIPVDALEVSAPGVGLHQQDEPAIRYSAGWTSAAHSQDSGGSGTYASRPRTGEVSASFTFIGNSISWIGRKTASSGIASVRINGVAVGKVDRYSPQNLYQQNLFTWNAPANSGDGLYTITISTTSSKNAASSSFNMFLDAFAVSSTQAALTGISATATDATSNPLTDGNGARVSWTDPLGQTTTSRKYQILRAESATAAFVPVAIVGSSPYVEQGLTEGNNYRYAVKPVFGLSNGSSAAAGPRSGPSTFVQPSLSSRVPSVSECSSSAAAAATPVTTSLEFQAAMDAAQPGSIIVLSPTGTFGGFPKANVPSENRGFVMTKSGTAQAPITICGKVASSAALPQAAPASVALDAESATLDMNGPTVAGYTLKSPSGLIINASHVRLAHLNVRDAFSGIEVGGGTNVRIDSVHVANTGQGGVYLRAQSGVKSQSSDVSVVRSSITEAGQRAGSEPYGEGIYVGHSLAAGCNNAPSAPEGASCYPDRTNSFVLAYNRITETTAQAIEAKEQTSNGLIYKNELGTPKDQSSYGTQITDSTVALKGSNILIYGNTATARLAYGFQTLYGNQYADTESSGQTWGVGHVYAANSVSFVGGTAANQTAFAVVNTPASAFRCSNATSGTPVRTLVVGVVCAP